MPEQRLTQLKDVTMTAQERELIRHRLRAYTTLHTPRLSVPLVAWRWAARHGVFALGMAALLLTAGTSVSANRAHPGDTLYAFRLSVNDRIETALAFSDDAQIDVEMQQMQRMIDDEDTALSQQLDTLNDDSAPDSVESVEDDFEAELRDIERDVLDEQEEEYDAVSDEDDESQTYFRAPKSADDEQLERELRSIRNELEDEEERSGRELE